MYKSREPLSSTQVRGLLSLSAFGAEQIAIALAAKFCFIPTFPKWGHVWPSAKTWLLASRLVPGGLQSGLASMV